MTDTDTLFVITHAKTIWKAVFFTSEKQAEAAIESFFSREKFSRTRATGRRVMIGNDTKNRFTIHDLKKFHSVSELRRAYPEEWSNFKV